jgi:anti-sigma factor RsiW
MGTNVVELWCQELVELVTEYLENRLTAEDRVRFEKHLLTCPPCTSYLAQMRTTIELAAELGTPPAASDGPAGVVDLRLLGVLRKLRQGQKP